jgi:hypothetical protein
MAAQLVETVGAYSDFSRLTLAYREPMQSARASSADHLFECCDISGSKLTFGDVQFCLTTVRWMS